MNIRKAAAFSVLLASGGFRTTAQLAPSTDDLWDVSRGAVITGHSQMITCCCPSASAPFDARDIFGGNFSPACNAELPGSTFIDGMPNGFVRFVEWALPNSATIRSFNLWASGDGNSERREMGSFRLLAKSAGSSTYDLILFQFVPSHPYKFVDGINGLLISSDIRPTIAREFRAEFVNRVVPGCCDGPRIIEMDGFADSIGPRLSIRTSEAELSWDSIVGLKYQVEYREDLPDSNWSALASPVLGDGTVVRITEKIVAGAVRRFYRIRATE